jgi:hypothetical protein
VFPILSETPGDVSLWKPTMMKWTRIFIAFSVSMVVGLFAFAVLLSDQQRAKLVLKCCDLPVEKQMGFEPIAAVIKEDTFHKWTEMDAIPERDRRLLNDWLEASDSCERWNRCSLEDVYAVRNEDWNGGCTIGLNKKLSKFDHLLSGENGLVLATWGGGLAAGLYFDFFQIGDDGKLILIGSTRGSYNLFNYALLVRFDPHIRNWITDQNDHL